MILFQNWPFNHNVISPLLTTFLYHANPLIVEKHKQGVRALLSASRFLLMTCPASRRRCQGITLTLTLSTGEGVQSFYSWKYFHTLSKYAKKTKCLMPLFSCLAKSALHNLLTQPVLKKDYLGSTNLNFYIYLLVGYLGSEVLKLVPCYLFLYFLRQKKIS